MPRLKGVTFVAAITFDTLKFVDTLEQAQMSQEQARAIATAVRDAHNAADVATKGDIRELRQDMEIMRRDIIIKLGAMVIGMGVILIAAMGAMAAFLSG